LETWIFFTLLAATMQAVRTAGQKQLSGHLNSMATTGVRYIYALPFAWCYLFWLMDYREIDLPAVNISFLQSTVVACIMQIIGTACLVAAFRYRNFAVATSLAKTEAIQVAFVGALLFSTHLSTWGWVSVVIGVIGVLIVSKVKFTYKDVFQNPGAGFGLASGLALAITTLLIRQSSLSLQTDLMVSAAFTLVFMVTVQSDISVVYVYFQDKSQFSLMIKH